MHALEEQLPLAGAAAHWNRESLAELERGRDMVINQARGIARTEVALGIAAQRAVAPEVIEERQGHFIAALEEIAFIKGFITKDQLIDCAAKLGKSPYGEYLMDFATRK